MIISFLLKDAENSLRFYRNIRATDDELNNQLINDELEKFEIFVKKNDQSPSLTVSDFGNQTWCVFLIVFRLTEFSIFTVNPLALRALLICPFLMAVNQFSGAFAITTYAETIFKRTGSNVDPQISSIVMAAMQVVGTYTASQLIDKVGRKMLLLVSLSGCFLSIVIAGTYSYLAIHEFDVLAFNWVPVVSISCYISIGSIGILPVPYVMMSEVIPQRVCIT